MNIYEHIAWIFVNYNESLPKCVFTILWGMLGAPKKSRVFPVHWISGEVSTKIASLMPSRSTNDSDSWNIHPTDGRKNLHHLRWRVSHLVGG